MNDYNTEDSSTLVDWDPAQMLEIVLLEPDDFLKVKETLTRIGVSSQRDTNTLYQSCHILHKQGRYFIVHFKELFLLDGKPSNLTYDDICRRNTISQLLADWGLVSLHPPSVFPRCSLKNIKIIPFKDKKNWNLFSKYSIGNVKRSQ